MINIERAQRLSDPHKNDLVMSAWERLVHGNPCESNVLRPLVTDSWQRCLHAHIDPFQPNLAPALEDTSFRDLQNRHAALLSICRPVMQMARDDLDNTGAIMMITDPQGVILSIEGDSRTRTDAENVSLMSGHNWNELASGTNAIGTALVTGSPVQIHAAEHFCHPVKDWTCTATVIRDPLNGNILGAVNISGRQKTYTPNTLAFIATTASRIENLRANSELRFRCQLLEHSMDKLACSQDGIIIVNRHGTPITMNRHARAALHAWAIHLKCNALASIPSLNLADDIADTSLPDWINPEWLETVTIQGTRVGTILTIPRAKPQQTVCLSKQPELAIQQRRTTRSPAFSRIIGHAPPLLTAIDQAQQLAAVNVPVLVLGETGVGKENIVRAMHQFAQDSRLSDATTGAGAQAPRPFVALNCGALSADLLASELFGYADGAFTGARKGGMTGKVEAAHGGTLFLDEIGEMPLALQPHLLRVLEEGEIYRIGETSPRQIQFKLIAATHRNLQHEVAQGRFREDLYYRLSVTTIRLPSLREMAEDIPLLATHLLQRFAEQYHAGVKSISDEAMAWLCQYRWPGNIRELRNTIESMYLTSTTAQLHISDLPAHLLAESISGSDPASQSSPILSGGLQVAESQVIQQALRACRGNLTLSAQQLGVAKSTLYAKLNKFGLIGQLHKIRQERQAS
ncbi:sigma-54-dependent Fis family transcriptional regulator [Advenella mimigardefordensis]|uniref:Transcriptional regulator, sigma-54 dependent n=1 Tax=Advenella mimigardefordensis (strain DSM 17166 / LMG 22922 / DPN7) TaxID=1247726 RepID=W0P7C4_ADVMD|nr:sigma-54-dependent Fis family transcriptional regulator [Advenella mimigardefordensis]AHG62739.1 transcriptional regulator, sigma-54 dependent [Advenella mimigardefordensis DPN7]